MNTLQTDSFLQGGRYKIISTLGQGGFGITYLAIQSGLERKVAIKEFFMKEHCERDESTSHVTLGTAGSREMVGRFREKFLKEARNIAKLNHPNIVRIIDVFEENGTAYYVMEYAENGSLADKVKREGYLSEPVATRYILQVASALDYIHQQKMNHLDVKPANIMLNEKDESVLIDFGLSKQFDVTTGKQTTTTPLGLSEGYAPLEQYDGSVRDFAPEIDVYALGATFFKLLTGNTPPAASVVNNDGIPVDELKMKGISDNLIALISNAMEGRKIDRMKSVQSFINGLNSASQNSSTSSPTTYVDDEATVLLESQKLEEERIRKETEARVARDKAKADARAKAESERRAREELERKEKAEKEKCRKEHEVRKLYNSLVRDIKWPTFTFIIMSIIVPVCIGLIDIVAAFVSFPIILPICAVIAGKIMRYRQCNRLKEYIDSHPNDPYNTYLMGYISDLGSRWNPYT